MMQRRKTSTVMLRDDTPPNIADDNDWVCESKSQLVAYLESGCKPPSFFRLGVEQERFIFQSSDYSPAVYDGPDTGIKALLKGMQEFGWRPAYEADQPIALYRRDTSITLEPGGQFEFSGAPLMDAHQIFDESQAYKDELGKLGERLGLSFLSLGHHPKHTQNELPMMPKQRYGIMGSYMSKKGTLGLDMMKSTCSIQVNMDFSSEVDMVKKFRLSLALQPMVTALFANSPFAHGKPSGYFSYRSHIWQHTDNERCGGLPFVFEQGMGFERYTDYVLDVPMYFVLRNGKYIDARGLSFRDFLAGQLAVLPGQRPLLSDWANHLSTVFPNVRLKKHFEMRGADASGSSEHVAALSALWAGLLYDSESMDAAWEIAGTWTREELRILDIEVARHGLSASFRKGTVQDICLWMLDLSQQGLQRRNLKNQYGKDESYYLTPLREAAQKGWTFAEQLLLRYENEWHQDIDIAIHAMCRDTLI
ncbi:MAG: glutamate--cysteine ligase [Eudoraea sp.]|uniref:glutamate--cysteine ligase n=1 Tax=Eudoraea sp. TaxID=1979955 RepID=UPI0032669E0C